MNRRWMVSGDLTLRGTLLLSNGHYLGDNVNPPRTDTLVTIRDC